MSRPPVTALVTTVVGLGIALAGCSSSGGHGQVGYRQGPVRGDVSYRDSDRTLHVRSCGAEFRVTESVQQVTVVAATLDLPPGAAACAVHDFTLALHAPLGARRVVDGTTGEEVPVAEWSRSRLAAPETPAPSLQALPVSPVPGVPAG